VHCRYEFETHDVDSTMATMVDAPYVNHIPTMAGGVGHDQLKRLSRTVGTDSLVDEMLFSFTHTSEIDWMLPGVLPTGRKVEVPLVAILHFRDGKLVHEHIYWDQAFRSCADWPA
jgi:carboxymethylenebutenolidase